MITTISYAGRSVEVEIPDGYPTEVLIPNRIEAPDEGTVIARALEGAADGPNLDAFLDEAREVLVLVNDGTRPTPTAKILNTIADRIAPHDPSFLVVTGAHRAATQEELHFIFDDHLERFGERTTSHDARDERSLAPIGRSRNGTEMIVNQEALGYSHIITITSVEPHYFAGYTGGWKSFLPGLAAHRTIEQNHALSLDPQARALATRGNPVREDIDDAARTIAEDGRRVFGIQVVLNAEHRVVAAQAGDIDDAFARACGDARRVFGVHPSAKADIAVAVAPYPMDIDLYQSQKAIDHAKLALAPGGILILVSSCRDGVGDPAFLDLLKSADAPEAVIRVIGENYKLGYHKAAKLAEVAQWAEMWAATELDPADVEAALMRPFDDPLEAIGEALKQKGSGARVAIFPASSLTVPLVPA
jgi:nickel-dependent lactate racemase